MPAPTVSTAICTICGELLQGRSDCLVCLLRGGLNLPNDEADPPASSLVFGDFEIERRADGTFWELGHGAMGVTYRARDRVLQREVALKVVDVPILTGGGATARERFLREARVTAALQHPNVAGVFQFGASGGNNRCYYAMELVEGETLEALVRREGPLRVGAALAIAIQVTRALVAAAAHGLIHRDLKPANIMLSSAGSEKAEAEVKVIDFGLAKAIAGAGEMDLTHGGFVGTPMFASPEQSAGKVADARSDIYSLGVTLWYALTGEVPYPGKTIEEIRVLRSQVALPATDLVARKVPAPVIRLLRRILAADPSERPQSARALLVDLENCRMEVAAAPRRRGRQAAVVVGLLVVCAVGLTSFLLRRPSPSARASREKSIAVLPFENLSKDETNNFFAAGIEDDVLTSLAKIHALKVISRTSVMAYEKLGGRNMREIGRALGVENVLEGSVRREGNRILLNVQLIDASQDRHIWAERYDRTDADSIGLQGELATQIAAALEAKLAPEEVARLAVKPTANPEAYTLYLRALGRERAANRSSEDLDDAEHLYEEAINLDPRFALPHARLSIVESSILGMEGDPIRKAKARREAEEAIRLAPSLGEAHMALGLSLYWADKNYGAALKEFSTAAATAPNEPDIFNFIAGIYRRQGRWRESLATYQRAVDLDPRDPRMLCFAAIDYILVRDWSAASATYRRALEIAPDSARARIGLAYLEVLRNNDPAAGRKILQELPPGIDPDGEVTQARWDLAMLERDYSSAEKILTDFPSTEFPHVDREPKTFYLGRVALARGDTAAAQHYFVAAVPGIEEWVRESPNSAFTHARLGLLYAYQDRKEDALREGRRAVQLEPESKDAFHGAVAAANLALIYARTGDADQAISLIDRLLATPGPAQFPAFPENITLADLRLRWEWDPLRSDPRFQRILAGPEPRTIYR